MQVLAMLMFSEFFDSHKRFSKRKVSAGGEFNFNTAILQMKTGEGKSIVIAMLAVFVVRHYSDKGRPMKVHILENSAWLAYSNRQSVGTSAVDTVCCAGCVHLLR